MKESFDWKTNNCATYVIANLKHLYREDFEDLEFLTKGKTKKEIISYLIKNDIYLSDIIDRRYTQLDSPSNAVAGDIVIEGTGLDENIGLCIASGEALFMKEKGLMPVGTKYCTKAWRVTNG